MIENGNGFKAELNREDFARAWASGDEFERGKMLFDLTKQGVEAKQTVKRHLAYIYGGLSVTAAGIGLVFKLLM